MSESYLVRLDGGPAPGNYLVSGEWPLPEILGGGPVAGRYVKLRESQLPPMEEGSRLLRGAEYEWVPDD